MMREDENPYRPPGSEVLVPEHTRVVGPAGRWRRFGTFLVDYVCLFVLAVIVSIAIALVFDQRGVAAMRRVPDFVIGSALFVSYYVAFEGIWSRTPGKWVFGTVVISDVDSSEAGTKPSMGQILGRTACRLIPFEPLSFFGKTGWHDRIPRTRVVRCR